MDERGPDKEQTYDRLTGPSKYYCPICHNTAIDYPNEHFCKECLDSVMKGLLDE